MNPESWGRVTEDGTVFVRIGETERQVGQFAAGQPAEALAFFTRRFTGLATEVELLEHRVHGASLTPKDAKAAVAKLKESIATANAVGDLAGLAARLDALAPVIAQHKHQWEAAKAERLNQARERKPAIVAQVQKLANGGNWQQNATKLQELLDEWKTLPRLDRKSDDELWSQLSEARKAFGKARKDFFSQQDERNQAIKAAKLRLIKKAEVLAESTDWVETTKKYRDLMQEWKNAGVARKRDDDKLWAEFRAQQDKFFAARDLANAELDKEFAANAEVKIGILAEIEAILPVTDIEAAKRRFRELADKYEAAGKVPRDRVKELDGRLRKVEREIRGHEDAKWQKSNPEAQARANSMVTQLESAIAELTRKLNQAETNKDTNAVKKLSAEIAAKETWLTQAKQALTDFS